MISCCHWLIIKGLAIAMMLAFGGLRAELLIYDGFEEYAGGAQVEPGANGSSGEGGNGGFGWGGAYDVNRAIKSLVRIENREASPVVYTKGELSLNGGRRALRFYDVANGGFALRRPLGVAFQAATKDVLWFSFLFRCNNASPLANQDFFQVGFEDTYEASNPRVSLGANTISTTFPPHQPFRFFARSTTDMAHSAFAENVDIASATTYLLVGCITASSGFYDTVTLYVDPTSLSAPGLPAAQVAISSGLATLSHFFIRTSALDSGDAYVIDELKMGSDYTSVVSPSPLGNMLSWGPASSPAFVGVLRWPAVLTDVRLETSDSLKEGSWINIPGPFVIEGSDFVWPVPDGPVVSRAFFRLQR